MSKATGGRTMNNSNMEEAVLIQPDIYWVGFPDASATLSCNPYLLLDERDAVLFDPGSIMDFPRVMRRVLDLVDLKSIAFIVASHQDADGCGSLMVLDDLVDHGALCVAAHSKTLHIIEHLGVRGDFYPVDQRSWSLQLESGRRLDFLPAPYLHSPGSIMTYDSETRSLFSGDLFGTDQPLAANDPRQMPEALLGYHQAYMPSNANLRPVLTRIETLEIDRILPHHGAPIEGEGVARAISFLKDLPCGVDLGEKAT